MNLLTSIEAVALADGKPAVFVAGNHEWASRDADEREEAATAAGRYGVTWLEMSAVDLNGVVVAGATLWEPGDGLHDMSVAANSDWIVDVGPGAGDEGGRIVASGPPKQVALSGSPTATYLAKAF